MINLGNVSFIYNSERKNTGIHNINLKIKKGEVVVLCGSSGCGKTTLTRILNGLIPNYYEGNLTGKITIDKKDMLHTKIYDFVGKVGSVFQNPRSQFFCVDTTDEMAFACENLMISRNETIERINSSVNEFVIDDLIDRNIFELSGGEKQKIACASVSALNPDIYVLDEPSSNLDIASIDDLKNVVKRWKESNKTVIISEHRLYWLSDIADKFVYMENGYINKVFTNEEFKKLTDVERHQMGLRSLNPFIFDQKDNHYLENDDILEIDNFTFSYKKHTTIDIEKLSVPKNSVFGILGDNGAGKSTFAKVLNGIEKKSKGTLTYCNEEMGNKKRIKNCYMVMQDVNHQLFTDSVMDEVLLSLENEKETEKNIKAEKILSDFNLLNKKDLHPMSLSGGEKQRVAIASAVATEKPIIILDEPTSGLDYGHMVEVSNYILDMKKQGKSIFIISHDPELIYRCCSYILFIENGKIKWDCQLDLETARRINKEFFMIDDNSYALK